MTTKWWQKPETTDDLIRAARAGLETDPTISTYTFIDGIEQRRPANVFAGLNKIFTDLTGLFGGLGETMTNMAQTFTDFMAQMMPFPFDEWFEDEDTK